jgi:hypothetical protein
MNGGLLLLDNPSMTSLASRAGWLPLQACRDPAIPKLNNLRIAWRAGLRVPPTWWRTAADLAAAGALDSAEDVFWLRGSELAQGTDLREAARSARVRQAEARKVN